MLGEKTPTKYFENNFFSHLVSCEGRGELIHLSISECRSRSLAIALIDDGHLSNFALRLIRFGHVSERLNVNSTSQILTRCSRLSYCPKCFWCSARLSSILPGNVRGPFFHQSLQPICVICIGSSILVLWGIRMIHVKGRRPGFSCYAEMRLRHGALRHNFRATLTVRYCTRLLSGASGLKI